MLRLNPTQLRLEAQDFKWHVDRLDARRVQRNGEPSNIIDTQGATTAYKHADIIDPSSLPFQALPIARKVPSPPFPSQRRLHDWRAVWEQLNRGAGFSPKVQSVSSGTPILVTPSDTEIRSSSASIEGDSEGIEEDPICIPNGVTIEKGSSTRPRKFTLPILSVSRLSPRRDCVRVDHDHKKNDESLPTPIDHIQHNVLHQVSESVHGTFPRPCNDQYVSRMDVDGSRDERAPAPRWNALARKSSGSSTCLNPAAVPFRPRNHRQVDYLRRPSGTLVPSPLHTSYAAASSSPSRRSGSAAHEANSMSSSPRLLSGPPRRLRGPGSSPFTNDIGAFTSSPSYTSYDLNPARNFSGYSDHETRFSPERANPHYQSTSPKQHLGVGSVEQSSDDLSSSSPFTQAPSPQNSSDPPTLPPYPFHHTPRNVSNTAALPSPSRMPSSPPIGHIYTPHSAHRVLVTPSPRAQPPSPRTPTAPRSSFRIYNDRLPTTSQPQTPFGLPRYGIPAELSRGNFPIAMAAYTAPERTRNRSGTQLRYDVRGGVARGGTGTEVEDRRGERRLERRRDYASPTRVGRIGVNAERETGDVD